MAAALAFCSGCTGTKKRDAAARETRSGEAIVTAQSAPRVRDEAIRAVMLEVDDAFKNVGMIRATDWGSPPGHGSLNAFVETARIQSLLSDLVMAPAVQRQSRAFRRTVRAAADTARALRSAMNCGNAALKERHYAAMVRTCNGCHGAFRDQNHGAGH